MFKLLGYVWASLPSTSLSLIRYAFCAYDVLTFDFLNSFSSISLQTHGARRPLCKHPGCEKAVKSKGFCSGHGPKRKTCDVPDCTKVAVQGVSCYNLK